MVLISRPNKSLQQMHERPQITIMHSLIPPYSDFTMKIFFFIAAFSAIAFAYGATLSARSDDAATCVGNGGVCDSSTKCCGFCDGGVSSFQDHLSVITGYSDHSSFVCSFASLDPLWALDPVVTRTKYVT